MLKCYAINERNEICDMKLEKQTNEFQHHKICSLETNNLTSSKPLFAPRFVKTCCGTNQGLI